MEQTLEPRGPMLHVAPPRKLLLAECKHMDGDPMGIADLLAEWPAGATFVGRHKDLIVVRCDPFTDEDAHRVSSLLVRPYFGGDDLNEALRRRAPMPVIAYWRRYGFAWSDRSVRFAQRFRLGIGGALMATLVPLLEAE